MAYLGENDNSVVLAIVKDLLKVMYHMSEFSS